MIVWKNPNTQYTQELRVLSFRVKTRPGRTEMLAWKNPKHTNTYFQSHEKKLAIENTNTHKNLRVLRFRGKNQAKKDWNAHTTKICLLMTQQCYSKHRNLNHSKLQIKDKTTWEARARKTTGSKGKRRKWRIQLWQKNQTPNKGGTPTKQNTEQHPNPHNYYLSPLSQHY
jgi:hypothetical protein